MNLGYFPWYCGGRILVGLWVENSLGTSRKFCDENAYKNSLEQQPNCGTKLDSAYTFCPWDLDLFKSLLKEITGGYLHGKNASIGVIVAVTNPGQTVAAKNLSACGFKPSGSYKKHAIANECITWLGDWRNDIWPTIADTKKPGFIIENKPKFAQKV